MFYNKNVTFSHYLLLPLIFHSQLSMRSKLIFHTLKEENAAKTLHRKH